MNTIDSKRLFTTEQRELKHSTDLKSLSTTFSNIQAQIGSSSMLSGMSWQDLAQEAASGRAYKYVKVGQTLVANNNTWNHGVDGEFIWQVTDVTDTDIGLLAVDIARKGATTTALMLRADYPQKETNAGGVANPGGTEASKYGSNLYPGSWIDQWLNTDADKGTWGTEPTGWHNTLPWVSEYDGFMKGFDEDFLNAIKMTDIKVNIATVWQTPLGLEAQETISRKFYLLAREDVGFTSAVSSQPESTLQPLYEGATDADRIKYMVTDNNAARWWLRSPFISGASAVNDVYTSGVLSTGGPSNTFGVVPACRIGVN